MEAHSQIAGSYKLRIVICLQPCCADLNISPCISVSFLKQLLILCLLGTFPCNNHSNIWKLSLFYLGLDEVQAFNHHHKILILCETSGTDDEQGSVSSLSNFTIFEFCKLIFQFENLLKQMMSLFKRRSVKLISSSVIHHMSIDIESKLEVSLHSL